MRHYTNIILSKEQANDFIKKWMQKRIIVCDISKNNEDNIYFVTLYSGSFFKKIRTSWQFRPSCSLTDMLLGSNHTGLCFGNVVDYNYNQYKLYDFDDALLEKANKVVAQKIIEWEKKSPI